MFALYKHYIYLGKYPHEIMSLPKGERRLINAFMDYALNEGDVGIKIRNMTNSKTPSSQ